MFKELFNINEDKRIVEQFAQDTKLITKLRKDFIDSYIKTATLNKSPKFSLIKYGIEIDFFNSLFAQDFEDEWYEYLEDNDIEVSWFRKGSVISIKTYKV